MESRKVARGAIGGAVALAAVWVLFAYGMPAVFR